MPYALLDQVVLDCKVGCFLNPPLGSRVNLCRVRFGAKIGCKVWSFFQTPPRVQGHSLQSAVWDLFSQNCLEFTPMITPAEQGGREAAQVYETEHARSNTILGL